MLQTRVRNLRATALVLACLAFCATNAQSAEGTSAHFLFLELQRAVHDDPSSPKTPARLFALGEYYFRMGNLAQAERSFHEAAGKAEADAQELLTRVYLAEIERMKTGDTQPEDLRRLKETLSNKRFFSVFGESNRYRWKSELSSDYELVEHVDRMEVYLNGSLFYTISLP